MAITSQPQRASFPLALPLGELGGEEAWLKISQVGVLSTQRLGPKLGKSSCLHADHVGFEAILLEIFMI